MIPRPAAARAKTRFRLIDSFVATHQPKGRPTIAPHPATTRLTTANVPGEVGFSALGGVQQAAESGFDLEPPDQGLCAGGGYVMEFINDAMSVYDEFGDQLMAPISSASAFDSPGVGFSDPRCYYDSAVSKPTSTLKWSRPTPARQALRRTRHRDGQRHRRRRLVHLAANAGRYPYTAVNSRGVGYLLFSLSGPHNFPSPAYIRYEASGPVGPVIEATQGAAPDDSFGCYPAFVGPFNGGCRWGDCSMGVGMGGRVYMGAEMIPQGFRDTLTNWGTFIWSAPPP